MVTPPTSDHQFTATKLAAVLLRVAQGKDYRVPDIVVALPAVIGTQIDRL